jgi:DNA-binding NarL/FixJ family response regulator
MPLPEEPAWRRFLDELHAFVPAAASGRDGTAFAGLSGREADVLEHIAQGLDNAQIAARLGLSEKTVRNHITRVFDKIEVENRSQAIVRAREAGLGTNTSKASS